MTIGQTHINPRRIGAHEQVGNLCRRAADHAERFCEVIPSSTWNDRKQAVDAALENRVRNSAAGAVAAEDYKRSHSPGNRVRDDGLLIACRACDHYVLNSDSVEASPREGQ